MPAGDRAWLVGGEDLRWEASAPGIGAWLGPLVAALDGRRTAVEAVASVVPAAQRDEALALLVELAGERVFTDADAPVAQRALAVAPVVFRQDRPDWPAALAFNRERIAAREPWLWVSTGAGQRGYVGPLFLPDAGPCLECLHRGFGRLSPVPELHAALAGSGAVLAAPDFATEPAAMLEAILKWKLRAAAEPMAPAALFDLHVVEAASLAVTTHRVLRDPLCPACTAR